MKPLITYRPTPLGYSLAQMLWKEGVPRNRCTDLEQDATIVLYDEVTMAEEGFKKDPTILRIVVSKTPPNNLPRGIFWIKPDVQKFTSMIRALNPE